MVAGSGLPDPEKIQPEKRLRRNENEPFFPLQRPIIVDSGGIPINGLKISILIIFIFYNV